MVLGWVGGFRFIGVGLVHFMVVIYSMEDEETIPFSADSGFLGYLLHCMRTGKHIPPFCIISSCFFPSGFLLWGILGFSLRSGKEQSYMYVV